MKQLELFHICGLPESRECPCPLIKNLSRSEGIRIEWYLREICPNWKGNWQRLRPVRKPKNDRGWGLPGWPDPQEEEKRGRKTPVIE